MLDNCLQCKARKLGWFCHLPPQAMAEYDAMGAHVLLPINSILFTEGHLAHSVAVVCAGRLKLTMSSRDGKTLLVKIAKPGDVLGLSAALSKTPYEVTAQAIEHTQIKTFQQMDFLHFIQRHVEGSLHAAESLSNEYRSVLSEVARLALSSSIAGRVAHLLLELAVEGENRAGCATRNPHVAQAGRPCLHARQFTRIRLKNFERFQAQGNHLD